MVELKMYLLRGERYPHDFKGPRDIEIYEPSHDVEVWIYTYTRVMGITRHTIATRYLPLMMEGAIRQWINTLPPNNIYS
jgi:hypothetical protein